MLVLLQDKQGNTCTEQNGDVEDGISLGEVIEPRSRQCVDTSMEDHKRNHGANDVGGHWGIVIGLAVERSQRDSREKHLSSTVFRGRATGDLADEVQPAYD